MTDDLVKRLQLEAIWSGYHVAEFKEAADRIEQLEYALRSIAEVPLGAEIPDRITIWGLAVHMQETAKYALKGDLEKGDQGENNLSRLDL